MKYRPPLGPLPSVGSSICGRDRSGKGASQRGPLHLAWRRPLGRSSLQSAPVPASSRCTGCRDEGRRGVAAEAAAASIREQRAGGQWHLHDQHRRRHFASTPWAGRRRQGRPSPRARRRAVASSHASFRTCASPLAAPMASWKHTVANW